MKHKKTHKWLEKVAFCLIKAYKQNKKINIKDIRSDIDKCERYNKVDPSRKENQILQDLIYLEGHGSLYKVKLLRQIFDLNDDINDKVVTDDIIDNVLIAYEKTFTPEIANLKVVRYKDFWALEKSKAPSDELKKKFFDKFPNKKVLKG